MHSSRTNHVRSLVHSEMLAVCSVYEFESHRSLNLYPFYFLLDQEPVVCSGFDGPVGAGAGHPTSAKGVPPTLQQPGLLGRRGGLGNAAVQLPDSP